MKKTIKTKKITPLERIAIALEDIALSLSVKKGIEDITDMQIELSKLEGVITCKKLVIKPFPEFVGKPRRRLYEYLKKNHLRELAGEDEISDIFKNPEYYPELKDGNWYYFFGATFCNADGDWSFPCVVWAGSEFARSGYWLDSDWYSNDRVVSLEIAP